MIPLTIVSVCPLALPVRGRLDIILIFFDPPDFEDGLQPTTAATIIATSAHGRNDHLDTALISWGSKNRLGTGGGRRRLATFPRGV